MSDIKLVSPLLDGFVMGEPMSSHDGVSCCPAMKENADDKYIVKIISVPASQKQLDALLLTGAYSDAAAATEYFKELSDGIVKEAETLQQLAKLEGFLPYDSWQVVPMEDGHLGYQVYLLGSYKRSLEKFLRRNPMTHLGAVNLGLDLCAALAICRRAGYLYLDLKPANIYLTGEREFRIGDLGFADLKSLKYTALPSKYRSVYTAPELHDALATLNPTLDTYAVGMILYQIYNNGQLPFQTKAPSQALPAPLNADYEMAEIIMKAIDPDPRVRWQNPIDMGQALVGYMQRNIVNDTPIVPPAAQPVTPVMPESQEDLDDTAAPEEAPTAELDLLSDMADQTAPDAEMDADLSTDTMSDEVSSMLAQADELLTHQTPEPMESHQISADEPDADFDDEMPQEPEDVPEEAAPADEAGDDAEYDTDDDEDEVYGEDEFFQTQKPRRKGGSWLGTVAIVLVLALVIGGGFYFYKNLYLLEIENMDIRGEENSLTVQLQSAVDESLLRIVCTDTYGNTISQNVVDGQAVFNDLNPATTYKITVEADGFHGLTGAYTGTYTTQEQTKIVDFTGITGAEDGSVILNFTVDGREAQDWLVRYSTEGEQEQSVSFTGHMVTINNLTVGKTYTFTLESPATADLYITGNRTLEFIASRIVLAEDLRIVSCENGVLTAQWSAPADIGVDSWTVRCYANDGYDETVTVSEATAQFSGISTDMAYTVEVTASGMGQGTRAYVTANPVTVSDMQITANDENGLTVTWESATTPAGGWLLMYSMDGGDYQDVIACSESTGTITPLVPGARYSISVQASDGSTVFGGLGEYTVDDAAAFDSYSLKAADIQASLCLTPDTADWTHEDLTDEGYTTTFAAGQNASMVLYSTGKFKSSADEITIMYVVRTASGKVLGEFVNSETVVWKDLWSADRYAYLDLKIMPQDAGSYSMDIYFNGALVTSKSFSITAE